MFYTRSEHHTWIEFLRSFSLLTIASSIIQNFAATPFELQRLSEVDNFPSFLFDKNETIKGIFTQHDEKLGTCWTLWSHLTNHRTLRASQ
jgi:hypothetical protein